MRRTTHPYRERIITLYKQGNTIRQIIDKIGEVQGAKFQNSAIENVITLARAEGIITRRRNVNPVEDST